MKKEYIYRVFSHMPEIITPRLQLRKMMMIDTEDMFSYASKPETTKYLTWKPHKNSDYTKQYLEYLGTRYASGLFYDWAIVFRQNNKMIGTCGFTTFHPDSDSAEVGYVVNPAYWNHGIATEALLGVLQFGFETLKLHRIEARYLVENIASRHVMEKVGMHYEGICRDAILIDGVYRSFGICSILFDEWKTYIENRNLRKKYST